MSEERRDWLLHCYDDRDPVFEITFSDEVGAILEGEGGILMVGALVREAYRSYTERWLPERQAKRARENA